MTRKFFLLFLFISFIYLGRPDLIGFGEFFSLAPGKINLWEVWKVLLIICDSVQCTTVWFCFETEIIFNSHFQSD